MKKNKEKISKNKKIYVQKNKNKINEQHKIKRKTDKVYNLKHILSSTLRTTLKRKNYKKILSHQKY